jgi:hypothetical protein
LFSIQSPSPSAARTAQVSAPAIPRSMVTAKSCRIAFS